MKINRIQRIMTIIIFKNALVYHCSFDSCFPRIVLKETKTQFYCDFSSRVGHCFTPHRDRSALKCSRVSQKSMLLSDRHLHIDSLFAGVSRVSQAKSGWHISIETRRCVATRMKSFDPLFDIGAFRNFHCIEVS